MMDLEKIEQNLKDAKARRGRMCKCGHRAYVHAMSDKRCMLCDCKEVVSEETEP